MNNNKRTHRLIGLILAIVVLTSPLQAQQRRNAPKKPASVETAEPVPTFDSLLAADSYNVYIELRAVGGLIRSPAVNDLLEPLTKLGKPPKEFQTLTKWLDAHAEILAGSRMMVATMPSNPKLPMVLVAIEFSSPEEAKKFYPELRDFLPKLLPTPTPTPTPSPSPSPAQLQAPKPSAAVAPGPEGTRAKNADVVLVPAVAPQKIGAAAETVNAPALPAYQMKQAGSLVFISDIAFTFRSLRPRGSKALEEDQNFAIARNRFATESLFLYFDLKSIEKEEKAQRQKWEEEELKRAEAEAANPPKVDEAVAVPPEMTTVPPEEQMSPSPELEPPVTYTEPIPDAPPPDSSASATGTLSASPAPGTDEVGPMVYMWVSALLGGESKWPEAVGAAVVFENDAYVVRTLILNSVENKGIAIPFLPQFVSGPAIVPESPTIFPADTNLFICASVDYPQIYEGLLTVIANNEARSRKDARLPAKEGAALESPYAFFEKRAGIKIKDDLLPLLGNELAFALAKKPAKPTTESEKDASPATSAKGDPEKTSPKPADPSPVFAVSVKDREAVGRLIPKIIEGFGLKGANLFAQTEKREGTEITSYAGVFSYAFVGDFLVLSPDAAETRRIVDAYLNHQTLASDNHFRNFTRWQPRQVLGQVYVGPDLMETYNPFGLVVGGRTDAKVNEFVSRLSPLIEPTTYTLYNDGSGPLHELHIPKNLLMWLTSASLVGFEQATVQAEEASSKSLLRTVHSAEETFQATEGDGRYGTFDELVAAGLLSGESRNRGYRIEVTASGKKFEATAVPTEYGVTGTLSYFIDESGVLRGGDHGGGPATVADQPVQ